MSFFDKNYEVKRIGMKEAKEYICANHYTHGCHNAPSPCYGLFEKEKEELIGVLMFAQPCSENVRASIWGKENKEKVIELHRLHIQDVTPRNAESWFIGKCLKEIKKDKPKIRGILSFADSTEGHYGVIYKASNFFSIGKTSRTTFYRDTTGRLRHPRQNTVNIPKELAESWGWTPETRYAKNRYLMIIADSKAEKKQLIRDCRYDVLHKKWCEECGKEMDIMTDGNTCTKCKEKLASSVA